MCAVVGVVVKFNVLSPQLLNQSSIVHLLLQHTQHTHTHTVGNKFCKMMLIFFCESEQELSLCNSNCMQKLYTVHMYSQKRSFTVHTLMFFLKLDLQNLPIFCDSLLNPELRVGFLVESLLSAVYNSVKQQMRSHLMYVHNLTLDCIAFSSKSDLTEIKSISRSHSIGTL